MQERRKLPRKNLVNYSQIFDQYGGRLLGYLDDLNVRGAMVIGEKPISVDTELTLAFELPDLPGIKTSRMSLPARVVWCQPDLSPQYFNIGFEFREVTPEQETIINSLMQQYEFRREMPNFPIKPLPNQR
jgi:Tfp pilus assembly protein PilZ